MDPAVVACMMHQCDGDIGRTNINGYGLAISNLAWRGYPIAESLLILVVATSRKINSKKDTFWGQAGMRLCSRQSEGRGVSFLVDICGNRASGFNPSRNFCHT